MPIQALQNRGWLQRLEQTVAGEQNGLARGHRLRLRVEIDLMQVVDSDKTGERFTLGMVRGFRTRDLTALGRLIQQIREYVRAIDHVNIAAAHVIDGAVADGDEVQVP